MRTHVLLVMWLFSASGIKAQDIAGTWKGKIYLGNDTTIVSIEIESKKENDITGYSHCYFKSTYYASASVRGTYNPKTRELRLRETKIVKTNMPESSFFFLTRFILTLNPDGNEFRGISKCTRGSAKNKFSLPCPKDYFVVLDEYVPPEIK